MSRAKKALSVKPLLVAVTALFLAAALCFAGDNDVMGQSDQQEVRAVPIGHKVEAALVAVLGEDYHSRVSYFASNPKGLFQGRQLMLDPGTEQEIEVIGLLSTDEISTIQAAIEERLMDGLDPEFGYAIVSVRYFDKIENIFDKQTGITEHVRIGLQAEFKIAR